MVPLEQLAGRFKVIYADPCWEYYGDPDKDQAAGKHYNTMPFEELVELPVKNLLDGPGVILMWATGPKLAEAIDLMRGWGFHYRGIAYVWIKTRKDGTFIHGQGVRPSFVKPTTEVVLVGSTQIKGRTLPLQTESQAQLVTAPFDTELGSWPFEEMIAALEEGQNPICACRGKHSEKPIEVRHRIEELFGEVPRIELFARDQAPGWEAWGLETARPMESRLAKTPSLKAELEHYEEGQLIMELLDSLPQEKF
jgi:N6-adenosine-specific RNA methylase IME4